MNKTDLLLQMLEHPHDYSAAEWQQILEDDECRELYELMATTRGALDAARTCEQLTDEQIDAEWQSFEMENGEWKMENSTERPHSQFSIRKDCRRLHRSPHALRHCAGSHPHRSPAGRR